MVSLSQQERDRFATWLEQDAKTTEGMIEQMKKLSMGAALHEAMTKKMKTEAAAMLIVAARLRSTEKDTIGGGG